MKERSEKSILNAAMVAVTALPDVMAWRNNTGMAWQGKQRAVRVGPPVIVERGMIILADARPITFGLPGSADILGVHDGRAFGIETKALFGKQRDQQAKFQAVFSAAGGLYGLAYTPEQAVQLLTKG